MTRLRRRQSLHYGVWLTVLVVVAPPAAVGAELMISYPAIERALGEHVFDQEGGRRYLTGSPETPCFYAFLENPKVSAETGRLKVEAHFSGRSEAPAACRIGQQDKAQS